MSRLKLSCRVSKRNLARQNTGTDSLIATQNCRNRKRQPAKHFCPTPNSSHYCSPFILSTRQSSGHGIVNSRGCKVYHHQSSRCLNQLHILPLHDQWMGYLLSAITRLVPSAESYRICIFALKENVDLNITPLLQKSPYCTDAKITIILYIIIPIQRNYSQLQS